MASEQDGAAQVARLNELLVKVADSLTRQDKRITALESAMSAAAEMLALARQALDGHQRMIEALAPSQAQPRRAAVN